MRASFILLMVLSVTGCQQTQKVDVAVPASGNLSTQAVDFEGDIYILEVVFPSGAHRLTDQVRINITRGQKEKEKFISVGLDRNSHFIPRDVLYLDYVDGKPRVRVYLQINQFKLPVYQSPSSVEFDTREALRGVGRLVLQPIQYKNTKVRSESMCNASLVGDDLVLTAQHCMEDRADCDRAQFIVWNDSTYASVACKSLVSARTGSDQALIQLEHSFSKQAGVKVLDVMEQDFYIPEGTPLITLSDFASWTIKKTLLGGEKIQPKDKEVSKRVFLSPVQSSNFGFISSTSADLGKDPLDRSNVRRLSYYDLELDAQAGQSGSPVLNLEGKIVGVISTSGGYMTPLDPAIRELIR